jgi:hypothetical protein
VTRLYPANAAATFVPATKRGSWNDATASLTGLLGAKAGASSSFSTTHSGANQTTAILGGRWISAPLNAQTISGTVTWCVGSAVGSVIIPGLQVIYIYATAGDADVVRGTLLSMAQSATFTTTSGAGQQTVANLTSVALLGGDRLVIEYGHQMTPTSSTSRSTTSWYGNTGATDLTSGSTAVTTQPGWFDFSALDASAYSGGSTAKKGQFSMLFPGGM